MKFIFITRKVDRQDGLAGFTYNWVKHFAKSADKIFVIAWQKSERGDLPDNVELVSLPDNKLGKVWTLYRELIKKLPQVDVLFCHMNPEYTLLSAPLAKLFGVKIVAWYAHGTVTWKVRWLEKLADKVLSSSVKGFRWPSKKLVIIHQGIDTELFNYQASDKDHDGVQLITAGRISPAKHLEIMIEALSKIDRQTNLIFKIIGAPGLKQDQEYLDKLKTLVNDFDLEDKVLFFGQVANMELPQHLKSADIFLNQSTTGSIDKAILEAMACGCLPLTCNEAYKDILSANFLVQPLDADDLAVKIQALLELPVAEKISWQGKLRQIVVSNHNLDDFAKKVVEELETA